MRIPPPPYVSVGGSVPSISPFGVPLIIPREDDEHPDGWSSLIGIITAISGNVLISIALNTQRYAHIKLNDQWAEKRRLLKRAERRRAGEGEDENSNGNGNGTQNVKPAKERARSERRRAGRERKRRRRGLGVVGPTHDGGVLETSPLLGSYRDAEDSRIQDDDDRDSEDVEKDSLDAPRKSYLRSPYWWAGIIMMTIGEAGNFLAYGFAPASIVSPLGVVALISNCIIAPFFMKEPFRKRDFLGVLIAVAGAVTVALSASDNNPKLGPNKIWALIATWEFKTYLVVTSFMIICLMLASNRYGDRSIFIDLGLVGMFGGYTALSTKGVASMLSYSFFGALTFPVTYLLVAVLVFTAVMQIKYVNRALQRFDATQVIPTQFVLFTLSVIVGSAVLYRDFEKTRGDDAEKFIGGCALTFMGVWLITSARDRPSDEEDAEIDEEDDDAIILAAGEQFQDELPISESQTTYRGTLAESSDEESDLGGRKLSSRHRSDVSLPESLERNHWESGNASDHSTVSSPLLRHTRASLPSSMGETSPITENPWLPSQPQAMNSKSSFHRLWEPFSSFFQAQGAPSAPSPRAVAPPRFSAPELALSTEDFSIPPHTPAHTSHYDDHTPNLVTPNTADVAHHLSRNSLATLYPSPFTSPLSSSLSAVVADSLRRRLDLRSLRPHRPLRPRLSHITNEGHHTRLRVNSDTDARAAALENALQTPQGDITYLSQAESQTGQNADSESGTPDSKRRRTSISNVLSDLSKSKKAKLGPRSQSGDTSTPETLASDDQTG